MYLIQPLTSIVNFQNLVCERCVGGKTYLTFCMIENTIKLKKVGDLDAT